MTTRNELGWGELAWDDVEYWCVLNCYELKWRRDVV